LDLSSQHTPIEEHQVGRFAVFVKREDLVGKPPAPPLGKLRGLIPLLERLHRDGMRIVGCWDTRVSQLGVGVAVAVRDFTGTRAIIGYPALRGAPVPAHLLKAQELGAELHPTPANHASICFSRTRKYVEAEKGVMLPFGLESPEAVEAVANEASSIRTPELLRGSIVLSCGSGVTLAGLLRGLPVLPQRIIAVSAGRSRDRITRCLRRYIPQVPDCLQLREAEMPYYATPDVKCPFPCNPHYDRKAWALLLREGHRWPQPILFWNIGG